MNLLAIYDTETTGLPDWHSPSDAPNQPHIVQLAVLLVDADTRKTVSSIDVIVRPDGWDIPKDISEIHGITTDMAFNVGVPEKQAIDMMLSLALYNGATRIGYNEPFDARIARIAIKRYHPGEIYVSGNEDAIDVADYWKDHGKRECVMRMAKKVIPGLNKYPKLLDLYKTVFGIEMDGAHSAMGDAIATMQLYFALKDAQ